MPQIDVTQVTQLVTALTTLCGVIAGIVVSLRNGKKADATAAKVDENTQLTKEVHTATTGSPHAQATDPPAPTP